MFWGLQSQAALDDGAADEALALALSYLRDPGPMAPSDATFGEAFALLAAQGNETAAETYERLRWWLLRWSPRHDSGVVYARPESSEVWAQAMYSVVPMLALTRDFAPSDMQYRMHREHLLDPSSGRYRERFDLAEASSTPDAPSAAGSGWAAAAIARALHIGAAETPAEMRGRWQRETRALIDACAGVDDPEAAAMLAYAAYTGTADGWLPDSYSSTADAWAACGRQVTSASGRAFARMARAAQARG